MAFKHNIARILRMMVLAAVLLTVPLAGAYAQPKKDPPLPEPLQNLVAEGAQMRYLGGEGGLDGWIAIRNGQEQYFYVTPDGSSFVMGLLFDKNGKIQTLKQVQKLQQQSGADTLDLFAGDQNFGAAASAANPQDDMGKLTARTKREFKTPAEQLYSDVEGANWIPLGDKDAPYIYAFVDPQCPHCHDFINDLRKNYIEQGAIQVRIIPVGFRDDTRAQAAFLLAVPEAQKRYFAFLDGNKDAVPVTPDINEQGVERNLAIMQSWKINVTPFIVYRTSGGEVKIVQGRVHDIGQMLADIR